nr:reverse transcriptase domain, reverse transcriptase zinc-binding domain protein [Tanacetum cinerariifolium]
METVANEEMSSDIRVADMISNGVWKWHDQWLATHDMIMKWYPSKSVSCLLCNNCHNSMRHLFFECTYSNNIWEEIRKMMMQKDYLEGKEQESFTSEKEAERMY